MSCMLSHSTEEAMNKLSFAHTFSLCCRPHQQELLLLACNLGPPKGNTVVLNADFMQWKTVLILYQTTGALLEQRGQHLSEQASASLAPCSIANGPGSR